MYNDLYDSGAVYNEQGLGVGDFSAGDVEALQKALSAGSSADPSSMGTGGNTLQFESLEPQLINALSENIDDFKLMKMQNKNKVGSTVHQYTQALDSGSYEGIGTAENGDPIESTSEYSRNTRNLKYFQTKREVTLQASILNPAVGGSPEATEERMGAHVLLKGTEYYSFHGDESITPNLPSGYPKQIRSEAPQNVSDMGGALLSSSTGLALFEETVGNVYEQGGEISDAYFPPILARDWQDVIRDGLRFNESSRKAGVQLTTYQTMYGKDIWISGRAGIDKMYKVKTVPVASALTTLRPNAPTFALAAQATTGGTGFTAATAGTYRYSVYAIDASGLISLSATPANLALADGQEAEITITKAVSLPGTGYIVCRGKKDVVAGTDIREMYRVVNLAAATTVTLDQNDELPGTAEMLLLTSDQIEQTYQWNSFLEMMRFDLGRTRAHIPWIQVWYGTPDLKIAKRNALIKNVGHAKTAGWFS